MGPGTSLWVELDAEYRSVGMPKTRDRPVIQVPMGHFGPHRCQRSLVHAETVILAGDLDPAGHFVANRLIRTTMPELELPSGRSQREGKQLVTEADSKGWNFPRDLTKGLNRRFDRRRIAGPIGDEEAVDLSILVFRSQVICGDVVRYEPHFAPSFDEMSVDVALRTAVDRHHHSWSLGSDPDLTGPFAEILREGSGLFGTHLCSEIATTHGPEATGPLDQICITDRGVRLDHSTHGTFGSKHANDRPRIQVLQAGDTGPLEPPVKVVISPVVGSDSRVVANDETSNRDVAALHILRRDAVVPDFGRGHDQDLPGVGRIGQRLLVPAHGGVEDDLSAHRNPSTEPSPGENRAVLQRETDTARAAFALWKHVVSNVIDHDHAG